MLDPERHNSSPMPESGGMDQEINEYLGSLKARHYSDKSIAIYQNAFTCFTRFLDEHGNKRVQNVTAKDLEQYRLSLVQRNFAPSSLEVYLRTVRQFFNYLEDRQLLFINPARGFVIPKPPRKLMPVPSEDDIKKLLAQPNVSTKCGIRDRTLLEVAYATGARREELFGLTLHNIDLDRGVIKVKGKGKKERVLPIGKHAIEWLATYIKGARRELVKERVDRVDLWIDRDGKKLTYAAFQQIITTHSTAANLTPAVTAHALRRACATHMLRRGAHPLQLQMMLGHSTLRTLSQYLRLTITDIKKTHGESNPGQ